MTADGTERRIPPSAPIAATADALRHIAPPRRRRWWRAAAATGALVMLPFLPVEPSRQDDADEASEAPGDGDDADDAMRTAVATLEASRVAYLLDEEPTQQQPAETIEDRQAIATFGDLEIDRISTDTQLIGFHEAYHGNALSVAPSGPVQVNHNPAKSSVEPQSDAAVEPVSMILPTRARTTDAHSAIDVAIPHGSEVRAPVDGRVVNVLSYSLYGRYPDTRIEIVPDDAPDTVLVMLHVTGAQVEPGDTLVAGETVVADSPTPFPFESQIDRFAAQEVGQAHPHVHLELKPAA